MSNATLRKLFMWYIIFTSYRYLNFEITKQYVEFYNYKIIV